MPGGLGAPNALDRAAHRRSDEAWLTAKIADPQSQFVPIWRNRSLVSAERPPVMVRTDGEAIATVLGRPPQLADVVFLGVDGEVAHFAIDLSPLDEPAFEDAKFRDLRMVGAFMAMTEFTPLAYARGITRFERKTKFCAACGGALTTTRAGFAKRCAGCDQETFPRVDPAVMMLVTFEDRCLLARQAGFPPGMVSALAGFVEPGESVEACVHRETLEEVSLPLRNVSYVASQGWPFPQSLMIGYRCEAEHDAFALDEDELEAGRWYTRDELRTPKGFFYPPPMSLAHRLIQAFLNE